MSEDLRADPSLPGLVRRHLVIGWVAVAIGALSGLGLEALHGLKIGAYLDLDVSTRRHLWTLAHAHGTLLGVLHLALAATLHACPTIHPVAARATGAALTSALLLIPAGFFLGGLWFFAGDPGLGIVLVPLGGVALVFAAVRLALAVAATRA